VEAVCSHNKSPNRGRQSKKNCHGQFSWVALGLYQEKSRSTYSEWKMRDGFANASSEYLRVDLVPWAYGNCNPKCGGAVLGGRKAEYQSNPCCPRQNLLDLTYCQKQGKGIMKCCIQLLYLWTLSYVYPRETKGLAWYSDQPIIKKMSNITISERNVQQW